MMPRKRALKDVAEDPVTSKETYVPVRGEKKASGMKPSVLFVGLVFAAGLVVGFLGSRLLRRLVGFV
jgi:hypothetical protein